MSISKNETKSQKILCLCCAFDSNIALDFASLFNFYRSSVFICSDWLANNAEGERDTKREIGMLNIMKFKHFFAPVPKYTFTTYTFFLSSILSVLNRFGIIEQITQNEARTEPSIHSHLCILFIRFPIHQIANLLLFCVPSPWSISVALWWVRCVRFRRFLSFAFFCSFRGYIFVYTTATVACVRSLCV